MFPSPTGVNYYEYHINQTTVQPYVGFRPQQGLTIMNDKNDFKEFFRPM